MRDWEKLARACRRYLDAYNDEIADDITLGSVGNDLRIIAIREVQAAPRVFFPGDMVPAGRTVQNVYGETVLLVDDIDCATATVVEIPVLTREQWQAAVKQARAEREAKHDG